MEKKYIKEMNNKYYITSDGSVFSSKNDKPLKLQKNGYYTMTIDGKSYSRSKNMLVNEYFPHNASYSKYNYKELHGYIITDCGLVFNKKRDSKINQAITDRGYAVFGIWINGKSITVYTHRVVAKLFCENPYKLNVVNHKDGNKLNNKVDNLEWVSQRENAIHAHQCNVNETDRIYEVLNLNM